MAALTLIHTNDTHGSLTPDKLPFLKSLSSSADLYFDTGDCIKAGNLAIPVKVDPAWGLLSDAGCDASVPGNRESHPLVAGKSAKFKGCSHPVLCANWKTKDGSRIFDSSLIISDVAGLRVAVFGVMVPMVTREMATQGASQYLWDQPVPVAVELARELRAQADLVIALTHIGIENDLMLAESTTDIDLILGAHTHTVLETPEVVNGTPICQGGSHAKFIGRYILDSSAGLVESELVPWD